MKEKIFKATEQDLDQGERLSELLSMHVIDVQQLNVPHDPSIDGPETRVYQLLQSPPSLPGKVPVGEVPIDDAFLNDQFMEEAARRILRKSHKTESAG